jgi:D-arabinose 1-dehydrogenase-like Zn-dependent alcohol dehydrogenase
MLAFADATMLLPDGLSYEQAAPLFCAGYTVWSGLRTFPLEEVARAYERVENGQVRYRAVITT